MNVGIIGTCLSNLTATFLMQDYGWKRLNNAAVTTSSLFISQFIENGSPPALSTMQEYLGVDPLNPDINRYLLENYRQTIGLTEISPSLPGLWDNLHSENFDLLLLDNLCDVYSRGLRYVGHDWQTFDLGFALHLGSNKDKIANDFHPYPFISPKHSAKNWVKIIRWLKKLQPGARIVFLSAQYCTAVGDPERYERAIRFHDLLLHYLSRNEIEIIAPLEVPLHLTKLPEDREHFDLSIYKALAGYLHISSLAKWTNWRNSPIPRQIIRSKPDHTKFDSKARIPARSVEISLKEVIAECLNIPATKINEESAANQTDRWDSLKQIGIVLGVEKAFDVRLPFSATTEATSVKALRRLLLAHGVICGDHVGSVSFADVPQLGDQPEQKTQVPCQPALPSGLSGISCVGRAVEHA